MRAKRIRTGGYPPNWKEIVAAVRKRAGDRCECKGECGLRHVGIRCGSPNGLVSRPPPNTTDPTVVPPDLSHEHNGNCAAAPCEDSLARGWRIVNIVLTTAHLCHDPSCANLEHIRSFCQRCHLRYDRDLHARHARRNRRLRAERAGQGVLVP